MVKYKTLSKIKAAVVSAAMLAAAITTPAISTVSNVTAAANLTTPHTFIADGVENGERQGNVTLPKGVKKGDTITLNFTTDSKASASIGIYGFGTDSEDDGYYYSIPEASQPQFSSGGKSSFTCDVKVPTSMVGNPTSIGLGIWYPKDDSKWTLKSITTGGSSSSDPGDNPSNPVIPGTENDKSGTYTFVDNKDGTATITATLSAQYTETDAEGNKQTQFDYLLSQGYSEEIYAPYKDEEGNVLPERKEGDPINSHKFQFKNFGIEDMSNIKFQSFEYVVKSDDYDMSTLQYGGGINVKSGSPSDTEKQKGKDGYWYNDQGEEDLKKYGDVFEIDDVHSGYEATDLGGYAKITWDVPKSVQQDVDVSGSSNAVGFQYWWGKDDTKTSTNEEGEEVNYTVIPEIHLVSCTATYTRTVTVPYNETFKSADNIQLTSGDDSTNQIKLPLADLNLGKRDKLSAVLFTINSKEELAQFVSGYGISIDMENSGSIANVEEGWYPVSSSGLGNMTVINGGNKFYVMWILPEVIANAAAKDGELLFGYWYGNKNDGTEVSSVTIPEISYFLYRSQEDDITIKGEDGLEIPDSIEIKVGETYELNVNVPGSTVESSNSAVVKVDENGNLEGVSEGSVLIKVTTPEGQEAQIAVKVVPVATTAVTTVTTKTTTKATTTTTKAVTTTAQTTTKPVETEEPIDWYKVRYGDVNLDGKVNSADITVLAKYLINDIKYPLQNNTSKENADCEYDHKITNSDTLKLVNYALGSIAETALGPKDKSNIPFYNAK